jgi:hypothetical protein
MRKKQAEEEFAADFWKERGVSLTEIAFVPSGFLTLKDCGCILNTIGSTRKGIFFPSWYYAGPYWEAGARTSEGERFDFVWVRRRTLGKEPDIVYQLPNL